MQKQILLPLVLIVSYFLYLSNSFAQDKQYRCKPERTAKRSTVLFEDVSGKARAYGGLLQIITDTIIVNVLNDPEATEFLAIISPDQLKQIMAEQNLSFTGRFNEQTVVSIGGVAGVHELVVGQITQINYKSPNPIHTSWARQSTIRLADGSNVVSSARVTHTQVESSVTIIGNYKIIDVKTRTLKRVSTFTTKYEFSAEWAGYSGDEAALNKFDRALVEREEVKVPVEEEMVLRAADKLASELAEAIKVYAIRSALVPILKITAPLMTRPVVGENIVIKVDIRNVEDVAGYQATISYDPSALRYVSSKNGNYLPQDVFFVPPVVEDDMVTLAATSLTGENNGDGTLATLTFEIVAVKPSKLTLSNVLITDKDGRCSYPRVMGVQITVSMQLAADANADGVVNIQDMILVASNFGKTEPNAADVNGDRVVNIVDLTIVAGAIGHETAAPSIWSYDQEFTPTRNQIEQWLRQARQMDLTDPTFQRGILILEQLFASLTPKEMILLPNYPNPFNPETWIPYQLAAPVDVSIAIYTADGRLVRKLDLGHQAIGNYKSQSRAAHWDSRNAFGEPVASGVYFYTLTAGKFTATRKMLIRK